MFTGIDSPVDLSPNTRLRSVTFVGRFKEEELLEWAIPTLDTITSQRLERIVLVDCIVVHDDVVCDRCRPFDEALAERAKNFSFRRLEVRSWKCAEAGSYMEFLFL